MDTTRSLNVTKSDDVFDIINHVLLSIIFLLTAYPLFFVIIASISEPSAVYQGKVWLFPREINFAGYLRIFKNEDIWIGYKNTILYTLIGTAINLFMTVTAAYPLSRRDFHIKKHITIIFTITMFFNGGMIPTYILVQNLGLIDTLWAMVLPNAVAVWNIIITRTYFQTTIPQELNDAAAIDGCNNYRFLLKIVLPLSVPVIAVMALFYSVIHWNDFFHALLYLRNEDKYPLQMVLRSILVQNQLDDTLMGDAAMDAMEQQRIAETIKYGVIIIGSLPVLILYPFIQKYFVKGIMVGSLKG